MLNYECFVEDVKNTVPAYKKFLKRETGSDMFPERFEDIPVETKQNYLLSFEMNELCRKEDMSKFHLIGASSGFSKTGAVYWPKRPCDEAGYMKSIESMFVNNYRIDKKRTLVLVCLAFGMWIGGMQISAALRNIALTGKYPFTMATPGLDIKVAVSLIKGYKDMFSQILIVTNPSNISLFTALLNDEGIKLPDGTISFPVVGEYFSESFREHVCKVYGHSVDSPYVVWTGYGSADAGDIGAETGSTVALRKYFYRNPELSERMFGTSSTPMILAISSKIYLEVIDGNFVVTKDQFIPLIRYNTGDKGGILYKKNLYGSIPEDLYMQLPDEMIYVYGRASNTVIFYGTNLMVNDINEYLLSLNADFHYGGLFTIREYENKGITCFDFTVYVTDEENSSSERYHSSMIDFLCKQSSEFKMKYRHLSESVKTPLITVHLADIKSIDTKVKHKYII